MSHNIIFLVESWSFLFCSMKFNCIFEESTPFSDDERVTHVNSSTHPLGALTSARSKKSLASVQKNPIVFSVCTLRFPPCCLKEGVCAFC